MGVPEVRNREAFKSIDVIRDYLRVEVPGWGNGSGVVLLDVDLVHRCYGPDFLSDSTGRVMLMELKYGSAELTGGQWNTFQLIDRLISAGDPLGMRYGGFWRVQYEIEADDTPYFTVAERLFLSAWQTAKVEGHDAVMAFMATGIAPAPTPEVCPW